MKNHSVNSTLLYVTLFALPLCLVGCGKIASNSFQERTIFSEVLTIDTLVGTERRLPIYSSSTGKLSMVNPDSNKEVHWRDVGTGFERAYPLPPTTLETGYEATLLLGKSRIRIVVGKELPAKDFDLTEPKSPLLEWWDAAPLGRTVVVADRASGNMRVIRYLGQQKWQDEILKTVKMKAPLSTSMSASPNTLVPENGRYFALSEDGSRLFSIETESGNWTTHTSDGANAPLKANSFDCVETQFQLGKQSARPIFVGSNSSLAVASHDDTLLLLKWNEAASGCVKKDTLESFKMSDSIQRISNLKSGDFSVTLKSGDVHIYTKKADKWVEKISLNRVCVGADEVFEMTNGKLGILCWQRPPESAREEKADIAIIDVNSSKTIMSFPLRLTGLASFIIDAKFNQAWMFYDSGFGKLLKVSLESGESLETRLFTKNLFVD